MQIQEHYFEVMEMIEKLFEHIFNGLATRFSESSLPRAVFEDESCMSPHDIVPLRMFVCLTNMCPCCHHQARSCPLFLSSTPSNCQFSSPCALLFQKASRCCRTLDIQG